MSVSHALDDAADLLIATVSREAYVSTALDGTITYGAVASQRARVETKIRRIADLNGVQILARGTVYLDPTPVWTTRDRITLPDGTTPPILAVTLDPDEAGDAIQEVLFQ